MKSSLFQFQLRQRGLIKEINVENITKERLHSLGLMKDAEVIPIMNTPLGCPRVYQFLNTYVAIRNDIAEQIEIDDKP